jgi:hypothetical protein
LADVWVAECKPDPLLPQRLVLKFERPAFSEYAAFWQTVYASPTPVQIRPMKGLFSRWTATLRQAAE